MVGKGGKVVLVPLPPAVGRAIDRAVGERDHGPILLNRRGLRMDRHCATRRLRTLSKVTTMLDAGVDLRPSPQEPRPAPELHPGGVHGIRNLTPNALFCRWAEVRMTMSRWPSGKNAAACRDAPLLAPTGRRPHVVDVEAGDNHGPDADEDAEAQQPHKPAVTR